VLSNLHALAADAVEADLLDYASDPPQSLALRFDPKLGPKRQAEAWFNRARKLERGAAIAADRASASRSRLAVLHALAERAQAATDAAALDAVAHQAQPFGIAAAGGAATAEQPATTRAQPSARLPYREFVGSGGRPILVGRGAADNDRLTLDHARPHDLWLHARDESGAHVVVPLKRDEACPPELLCDAATLTAHFSQARGQSRADVVYTQRRYVRKPRKAATGSVQLMREKVFALRLEPARLARLLAAEKHRRP
jgi:predicted ribosome quality control (RQC) complex YloA/Tae2 family protein